MRLAEVRWRAGRLDEAVDTAATAVDLAAGVDSARVRGRIDALLAELPGGEPMVAGLRDRAAEYR